MRVPASVQVAMAGTGLLIALGASGCSKGVEQPTAAETALAADIPADTSASDKAASLSVERERDSLSRTDLRTPEPREERGSSSPQNAWMFRGSGDESQPISNATPVSTQGTQASILPPQPTQPPTVVQPPKPQPPKPVVATQPPQPQRPPGWQIRAACGRG